MFIQSVNPKIFPQIIPSPVNRPKRKTTRYKFLKSHVFLRWWTQRLCCLVSFRDARLAWVHGRRPCDDRIVTRCSHSVTHVTRSDWIWLNLFSQKHMKRHNETPQKTKDQDQTQLLNPMDEWWHLNQVQVWNIHRGQRLVQRGSFWCLWWPWWLPGAVPLWFAVMAFLHFFQVAKFCERSCLNMFAGNGNIDVPCISHLVVWFFKFCNARLQVTYLKLSHPGVVWRCEDMWSAKGSKGRKVKVFLFFASRPSSNIVGFSEAVEKENSNVDVASRALLCLKQLGSSEGRRDDAHVSCQVIPCPNLQGAV